MAVVGDAYIVVRAITDRVRDDIRRGFDGAGDVGDRAGRDVGRRFSDGFGRESGRGDLFRNLERSTSAAADKFTSLVRAGYALAPALAALAGAASAAGAGLVAIGAQALAAGPALLSLIGIISAVIQAASVLAFTFSGVGAAISAGLSGGSGGGGGGGGVDLTRQIERATERVEDAKERLALVYQENARRIDQARDQIKMADRAVEDAKENVVEANKRVAESEKELEEATKDVTEARKEAAEQIQQLSFALEDAVLDEQRAALKLEEARETLAKVSNLPPNNRERREAQLAYDEAELRLRMAKDKASDTAQEVQEANSKGVEGSDLVVDALERERRAGERVTESKKAALRAQRDYTDALEAEKDAWENLTYVTEENKRRVDDAKDAIRDAVAALEDLKESAGAGGAAGGVDRFAEAMAKLSPAAQAFVRQIIDLAEKLKPIRMAAQEELFTRLGKGLDILTKTYLPILNDLIPDTAAAIGDVALEIANVITETENVKRVENIWRSNDTVIRNLGTAVGNLATTFLTLTDAAIPLTTELSEWVVELTNGWKESVTAADKTGELDEIMQYAGETAKTLGAALGGIFRGLVNIGQEAAGPGSGGEKLLNTFKNAGLEFEKWTERLQNDGTLKQYFLDAADNFEAIAGFVVTVVQELAKIGDNPGIAPFFDSLSRAAETLGLAGDSITSTLPSVGEFVEEVAEFIRIVSESNAIETFFDTLTEGFKAINGFLKSDIGQRLLDTAGPVLAFAAALGIFAQAAGFLVKAGIGKLIKPITGITGALGSFGLTVGGGKVAAAAAVIAAIAGAIYLMWTESEKFREEMGKLIDVIEEEFAIAWEELQTALEDPETQKAIEDIKEIFGMLGDLLAEDVLPVVRDLVPLAFDAAKIAIGNFLFQVRLVISAVKWFLEKAIELERFFESLPEKMGAAIEEIENFVGAIPEKLGGIVESIEEFFGSIPEKAGAVVEGLEEWVNNSLIPFFYNLPSTLINAGFDIFDFLIEQATNAVTGVFTFFTETFIPGLLGLPEDVTNAITGLWDSILTGAEDAGTAVGEWISGTFIPSIQELPGKVTEAVTDLFTGITDEAEETYGEVESWITDTFLPFFEDLPGKVTEALQDLFKQMLTSAEEVWDNIEKFFKETVFKYIDNQIIKTFDNRLGKSWDKLIESIKEVWRKVTSYWTDTVVPWLKDRAKNISTNVGNLWDSITDKFKKIFNTDIPNFWTNTVVPWLESLPGKVSSKIGNIFGGISSNFQSVIQNIVNWWNGIRFEFGPIPTNPITERLGIAGKSFVIDPPPASVPWAAEGGIVFPRSGGVLVGVAEAGRPERIEPLDPDGLSRRDKAMIDYLSGGAGNGVTINVYPSEGMNERELAQKISRELALQVRRGAV